MKPIRSTRLTRFTPRASSPVPAVGTHAERGSRPACILPHSPDPATRRIQFPGSTAAECLARPSSASRDHRLIICGPCGVARALRDPALPSERRGRRTPLRLSAADAHWRTRSRLRMALGAVSRFSGAMPQAPDRRQGQETWRSSTGAAQGTRRCNGKVADRNPENACNRNLFSTIDGGPSAEGVGGGACYSLGAGYGRWAPRPPSRNGNRRLGDYQAVSAAERSSVRNPHCIRG